MRVHVAAELAEGGYHLWIRYVALDQYESGLAFVAETLVDQADSKSEVGFALYEVLDLEVALQREHHRNGHRGDQDGQCGDHWSMPC